mmetsp:Transcript_61161/g.149732  ORF Transcript_61161/g.149732 Transcript_61161/m.149732 type:complete len:562 (-) Transcript_61161:39-1724(-)
MVSSMASTEQDYGLDLDLQRQSRQHEQEQQSQQPQHDHCRSSTPRKLDESMTPQPQPQPPIVVYSSLLYWLYSFQSAILPQFLPLYFQSTKGFDGYTVGWLSSIMPLSTFLAGPLWSVVLSRTTTTTTATTTKTSTKPVSSSSSSFGVLFMTILVSTIAEASLYVSNTPVTLTLARLIFGFVSAPTRPLLDSIVLDGLGASVSSSSLTATSKDDKKSSSNSTASSRKMFGRIRLFSIIGSGMGTRFGGYLLGKMGDQKEEREDFSSLFVCQSLLVVPVLWILWLFRSVILSYSEKEKEQREEKTKTTTDDKKNDNNHHAKREVIDDKVEQQQQQQTDHNHNHPRHSGPTTIVRNIIMDTDNTLFFVTVFVMGVSAGVNDSFTYVRFREVGCSTSDMGTSRLLSSLAGAVMFFFAGDLNNLLGMKGCMIFSVLVGCARLLLVMSMRRPIFGYIAEILRGAIYGAFWSTCTVLAGSMGPSSSRPVMLLFLNGAYNGIGRSAGSIIGGKLQTLVGTKAVFFHFSMINAALAIVLTMYYYVLPIRMKRGLQSTGKSTLSESKKQQ